MKTYKDFMAENQKGTLRASDFDDQYKVEIKKAEKGSKYGDHEWHVVQDKINGVIKAVDDMPNHESVHLLGTAVNGVYTQNMKIPYSYFEEEKSVEFQMIDELLSFAGRRALKRSAKQRKARLKISRNLAKKRTAPMSKILNRAQRRARRNIASHILGGKPKKNLSHAGLNRIQQMVNARHGMLDQLRRKMIPAVRADERRRKQKKKK